ncbi:MAG TPA: acetyltransferase [Bryobacteraceae bacterium]|jgi:predicted GNAT superfamily acetyltransferase
MEIRELKSFDDHKSVVDLQRAVWGAADIDILAPLSLRAAVAAGNLLLGVFDGDRIVGFLYGFLGMLDGQIELHSDMAGLLHEYRDRGLGYRLKLAQREWALARAIRLVTWTFDPLRSRNAYFNFHKLGAISDSYRVNFYGEDSTSILHRNGTDRLWMSWEIDTDRVCDRIAGVRPPPIEGAPIVSIGSVSEPLRHRVANDAPRVTIQIPLDPDAVPPDLAVRWREVTREAFLERIDAGYRVIDANQGVYLLERRV